MTGRCELSPTTKHSDVGRREALPEGTGIVDERVEEGEVDPLVVRNVVNFYGLGLDHQGAAEIGNRDACY